jgi:hypothetical protein
VAVKFVSLSQACQDHCLSIIEDLAENCSPREMFAAFMEVICLKFWKFRVSSAQ